MPLVEEVLPADWSDEILRALHTIRAACEAVDGQDPIDEAADLHLRHHGISDARLWLSEHGFALLKDGGVDLAVSPDHRQAGEATALLSEATEASTAWSHGNHPAAARLAERFGFTPSRELWVMRRAATIPTPRRTPPEGFEVRSYRPEDEAELLRVNASAFASHPEQGAMDADNLAERMGETWFDPAGLIVAMDGDNKDHMLGFHWTKRHSRHLGEVYVVGISPDAQGRGLGKRLTADGLDHLARLGVDEVLLYVEADNAPAVRLYEKLGFTHAPADTHVQYAR